MPFGLSTALRFFTMLLRHVLRMMRDFNVSVIAYFDDLLIFDATKEECLSNHKKTMELLVKLGFKLNLEKSNWYQTIVQLNSGSQLIGSLNNNNNNNHVTKKRTAIILENLQKISN
ncbi:hypothetical protein ACTFIR_007600 [Dictyostelium discoideum]